jgi:hypothetical protein
MLDAIFMPISFLVITHITTYVNHYAPLASALFLIILFVFYLCLNLLLIVRPLLLGTRNRNEANVLPRDRSFLLRPVATPRRPCGRRQELKQNRNERDCNDRSPISAFSQSLRRINYFGMARRLGCQHFIVFHTNCELVRPVRGITTFSSRACSIATHFLRHSVKFRRI